MVVGLLIKMMLVNFYIEKFFLGIDGFDCNYGFYGNDIMCIDMVYVMVDNVDKICILIDLSKFELISIVY